MLRSARSGEAFPLSLRRTLKRGLRFCTYDAKVDHGTTLNFHLSIGWVPGDFLKEMEQLLSEDTSLTLMYKMPRTDAKVDLRFGYQEHVVWRCVP